MNRNASENVYFEVTLSLVVGIPNYVCLCKESLYDFESPFGKC